MGCDDKGRVIWTKSANSFLATTDIVENDLDFVGNVKQTKTTHQKSQKSDIVIVDTFTYDQMNRLKTHPNINENSPEVIAKHQ